jgi:hypothetical protein
LIAEGVQQEIYGLVDKNRLGASDSLRLDEDLLEWLASVDHSKAAPKKRCRTMTWDKFYKHLLQGFGTGHGATYRPWLTLRRKNASKSSNQVAAYLFLQRRHGFFFSRGEYQIALLLLWLGVDDLREQFPLWPIAHPHPLFGALGAEEIQIRYSQGLLDIAKEAGIDHGVYPGTNIPYVATIDFMLTIRVGGEFKLVAVSCKPFCTLEDEIKWRTLERLELERRYAAHNKIRYLVLSSRVVPILMAGQLEWCFACSHIADIPQVAPALQTFAAEFESTPDLSIADAVRRASEHSKLSLEDGWIAFRHCAWNQRIDVDLSKQILITYPVNRGGQDLRKRLQHQILLGTTT